MFNQLFEELYFFAVKMDPFQMLYFAPYILNTPCKFVKLKFMK